MLAHVTMNYAKPQLIYAPGCSLNAALGERGGGGGPVAMGGHGVCVCVCWEGQLHGIQIFVAERTRQQITLVHASPCDRKLHQAIAYLCTRLLPQRCTRLELGTDTGQARVAARPLLEGCLDCECDLRVRVYLVA